MLRKIGLQGKLLFLCVVLALLAGVVGLVGYSNLTRVSNQYHHVASNNLPHVKAVAEIYRHFLRVRLYLSQLNAPGITDAEVKATLDEVESAIGEYEKGFEEYSKVQYSPGVAFGPGEKQLFDDLQSHSESFKESVDHVAEAYTPGDVAGMQKAIAPMIKGIEDTAKTQGAALRKLVDYNDSEAKKWAEEARNLALQANWLSLGIVLLGSILMLVVGYFLARNIAGSVRKITKDLSHDTEMIAQASTEIGTTSGDLSSSATEQAAALQETVASLEQVSAMVGKNAENAKRSKKASSDSQTATKRGNQVVGEMIQSIQEISDSNAKIMAQVEASNQEISQIVKVIAEISDKTKVINDIVFQTKLLSFNASVEAARAGEHGKGFAVVAEEVGKLAQMSGNASKEISALLESSIHKVENTVNETKTKVESLIRVGKDKVEAGASTAKRCGEVLEEIMTNVASVNEMVSEIAMASDEQAQGVSEINKAMNQMDQVTQKNAGASQQTASAAHKLSLEVQSLRAMVHKLFSMVDGEKNSSGAVATGNSKKHAADSHDKILESIHAPLTESAQIFDLKSRKTKAASHEPKHDAASSHGSFKKAVGDNTVPSGDDPRFEDV